MNALLAMLAVVMLLAGLYWCTQLVRERPPPGVARTIALGYAITWLVGAAVALVAIALPLGERRFAILALGLTFLAPSVYLRILRRRDPAN